jgi:hypothetical protein
MVAPRCRIDNGKWKIENDWGIMLAVEIPVVVWLD